MSASIALALLTLSITSSDAAKILAYFPIASISHQVVFRPLTQELAKRGHEVTVITTDPVFPNGGAPANLTEVDVHEMSYTKWRALYKITSTGDNNLNLQMKKIYQIMNEVTEMQMKLDKVQKIIKENKFDLLMLEACARPALLMSHVVKAPVIHVSSFGPMNDNVGTMGSAWHPILYPDILSKRLYNVTQWEKIEELWNMYTMENIMHEVEQEENEMGKRLFGPNTPTIKELKNKVEMLFLNIHPIWEGNRPVPPSVIYMGGLPEKPVKELPSLQHVQTMAMLKFLVRFFLCQVFVTDAARILAVYPMPSISHQVTFRPITMELVKRGHEVVVITADPMFKKGEAPKNLTEIDVHDISYKVWEEFIATGRGNKEDLIAQMRVGIKVVINTLDAQFQVKEVKDLIQGKQKFDLLLTEACISATLAFSHVYKVPLIQVSSFGAIWDNYEVLGAPSHPFLYPGNMHQRIYNLTMYEKLQELYNTYRITIYANMEKEEIKMIRKHFGPNIPNTKELKNNVHMLFLNVNPIWEGIRPVPPSVIHLGGLPEKPHKELPQDLKTYLDSSKNGVIYISFGTNVQPSLLPPDRVELMAKVFSKLPYDVLWKWDKDVLPGRSKNIRISKWLPQSDLLRHPKIKVFITQGGLQSTDEAITAGIPLIGIPMLGDQWYNVEKYLYHKIGVKLDLLTMTAEDFKAAINNVIEDKSFRQNIVKLNSMMRDQPQSPLDRGVWWIEYVLRHGGARHLRAPAANMSWAEYLELELLLVLTAVLLAFVLVVSLIVFGICKYFSASQNVKLKSN